MAAAPDGSWLATAGRDGTVRIWDPDGGVERHTLTGHTGAVAALAVAPDGSWLASAGRDGTVRIWDPDRYRLVTALRLGSGLTSLLVPSRDHLTAGGGGGLYLLALINEPVSALRPLEQPRPGRARPAGMRSGCS